MDRKVGPVACVRHVGPDGNGLQLIGVGRLGQAVQGLLAPGAGHLVQPLATDVVGATLQDGEIEGVVEVFGQERKVLSGQLVL